MDVAIDVIGNVCLGNVCRRGNSAHVHAAIKPVASG